MLPPLQTFVWCVFDSGLVLTILAGFPFVASGAMTGTIETTMFGSVARGDLELTKM